MFLVRSLILSLMLVMSHSTYIPCVSPSSRPSSRPSSYSSSRPSSSPMLYPLSSPRHAPHIPPQTTPRLRQRISSAPPVRRTVGQCPPPPSGGVLPPTPPPDFNMLQYADARVTIRSPTLLPTRQHSHPPSGAHPPSPDAAALFLPSGTNARPRRRRPRLSRAVLPLALKHAPLSSRHRPRPGPGLTRRSRARLLRVDGRGGPRAAPLERSGLGGGTTPQAAP